MQKEEIIENVRKIIRKNLTKEYDIIIFGSQARGDNHKTSDIDIAISGKKKIPWSTMVKIKEETGEIETLRKIDILDIRAVNKNLRNNILRDGIKI